MTGLERQVEAQGPWRGAHRQVGAMESRPEIGAMIRCIAPKFEAGAVTYSGHTVIELPHRTADGKITPRAFDLYQLKPVGKEWIYQRVELNACKKAATGPRSSDR